MLKFAREPTESGGRWKSMRPGMFGVLWLAGLAMVACGSDDGSPGVRTTSAPGTSAPAEMPTANTECPVAKDLCATALALQQNMWAANFDALETLTQKSSFTCPGPSPGGAGGPYPLCQGASPGEIRRGVRINRLQSDGGTVEASILPALRNAILEGGHGLKRGLDAPRVVGFHCPGTPGQPDCSQRAIVYVEGAAHFRLTDTSVGWKVNGLQFGNTSEDQSLPSVVGSMPYPEDSGLSPGVFMPWRPEDEPPESVRESWLFAPAPASSLEAIPSRGECPAEVALNIVPAPGTLPGGKEPVPTARIFAGIVGIEQGVSARAGFVEVRATGDLASGRLRLSIPKEACHGDVLTIVLGADAWRVTGYRVN